MSKDPAVLFYTSDFLVGTAPMTWEEKGVYITLLCYQHQLGPLSKEQITKIVGYFPDKILVKFRLENDKYVNLRMREETKRRSLYCESRKKNAKKAHRAYAKHMDNHMETITEDIDTDIKSYLPNNIPDTIDRVIEFFTNNVSTKEEAEKYFDYFKSNGWKVGRSSMKDWQAAARNWIRRSKQGGTYGRNEGVSRRGTGTNESKKYDGLERVIT